jgi:sucrose-6F-phosphate phosphohydrolase
MLVSDIDGTLLEDGEASTGLTTLRILLSHHRDVRLVYATGRSFKSTWSLVRSGILPIPSAIAASVGTELWLPPWQKPELSFSNNLAIGWNRVAVEEAVDRLPQLYPQPPEYQTPIKISCFLDEPDVIPRLIQSIERRGVRARILYSSSRYLDILPEGAGKRSAVEHLRRLWGVPQERVLACGDSANDLDMLTDPSFLGVAVGNSQAEIQCPAGEEHLYSAQLPFAAGVLEGAEVFGFWSG